MQTEVGYIQQKDYLPKPDNKPIYAGVPVWNEELGKYQLDWTIDLELYRAYALKQLNQQVETISYGENYYKVKLSNEYIAAMLVVEKEAEVTGSGLIELENAISGNLETIELSSTMVTYLKENLLIPKSKGFKTATVALRAATTTGEITAILESL